MKVMEHVFCLLLIIEGFQKVFWNMFEPLQLFGVFFCFFYFALFKNIFWNLCKPLQFGFCLLVFPQVTLITGMKSRYQSGMAGNKGRKPYDLPS